MQVIKDIDLSNVDISKMPKVEDFINIDTMKVLKEIEHSGSLSIPEEVMDMYIVQGTTSVHRPQTHKLSEKKMKEIEEKYLKNSKEQ